MQRLPGQNTAQFKVPLVGDTSVGKTSILLKYTKTQAPEESTPTVGVSTVPIQLESNGKSLELTIWDTAGQEKFRSLVPLYTRHSSLIILVFDISSPASLESINEWLVKLRSEIESGVPIFLCGNKDDLSPAISKQQLQNFADNQNCQLFYTSAITGDGIDNLFQSIADLLTTHSTAIPTYYQPAQEERAVSKKGCNC